MMAAAYASWVSLGETGQAIALLIIGIFLVAAIIMVIGMSSAQVDPDWVTDADHGPHNGDWGENKLGNYMLESRTPDPGPQNPLKFDIFASEK